VIPGLTDSDIIRKIVEGLPDEEKETFERQAETENFKIPLLPVVTKLVPRSISPSMQVMVGARFSELDFEVFFSDSGMEIPTVLSHLIKYFSQNEKHRETSGIFRLNANHATLKKFTFLMTFKEYECLEKEFSD